MWIKFENISTGNDVTINMDKVAMIVQEYDADAERPFIIMCDEEGRTIAVVFGDEDELLKQLGGAEHIAYIG